MTQNNIFSQANIESLVKFLSQNKEVNFLSHDLQNDENLGRLNFKSLTKKKEDLAFLLKAYQRLIRIIPEENRDAAFLLLKEGLHSALQIAAMTRKDFMARCSGLFGDEGKLAEKIYASALQKRSVILIQYMDMLQNSEPHISAARFS